MYLLCLAGVTLPAFSDDLATILGSPASEWRFTQIYGPPDHTLSQADGQPALVAGPNVTVITSLKPITGDAEINIRFRFVPATGKASTFQFVAGLSSPNDASTNLLYLSLSVPAGAETINWGMPALPGEAQSYYGNYPVLTPSKVQANWPELVRVRVEQDLSPAAPLTKHWLSVRYVLRPSGVETYVDDRLLREARGIGVNPEGHFRFWLWEGVQLASVRVRDLPPADPLFEPVRIDSHLNAAPFKGGAIDFGRLTEAGKSTAIHGVPFLLPTPDARGYDHIDVGRSWMRFGLLEGAYDGWEGDPARWRGALSGEQGRIQFRVRNGRYRALHLLAAASGEEDTVPMVTAQFYRASAGFPVSFEGRAPHFTARSSKAMPIHLKNGRKGSLHLVTIPLEPEGLASLADLDHLEFELTKEVRVYRSFPDPIYYSKHSAGLPSGVHVYAITLERAAIDVDFQPDKFAHIWTAPDTPYYTITLKNRTAQKRSVRLELSSASHDQVEKTVTKKSAAVAAGGQETIKMPIRLKRFGQHHVTLRVHDEQGTRTQTRSLAHLHPDTRERGGWEEGRGTLFGFWDWGGGHVTPGGVPRLEVMVSAGAESVNRPMVSGQFSPEELSYAQKHGMSTQFLAYQSSMHKQNIGMDFDASKPAEMEAAYLAHLRKSPMTTPTPLNKPELAVFWGEPLLGPVSYMSFPEYYGDPPYQMTDVEQANFKKYLDEFLIMARAIKKTWPQAKCLLPWGIPSFPIAYLRHSKEVTELMDGPAVDLILFERLPEMQMHQVTYASTLWQLKQEWLKAGKKWPNLISIEGVCASPATPGALTQQQEADHTIRGALMLSAYGVTRQLGWPTPFRCASHWGETHYGSGMCERTPLLTPKLFYCAHATMTRQLNRMNFVKTIDAGSATVFCQQFKHYKTGQGLHVFWTVRGRRPVLLDVPTGAAVTVYDSMDNGATLHEKHGRVTVTASPSPCYVWGLEGDARIHLGDPDHSDSQPQRGAVKLANPGDGSWRVSTDRDEDYENVHLEFVKKFPGKMTIQSVAAPKPSGGKALAVRLEQQEKERRTMPFYTTLVPAGPIPIPGKASHLGFWVRAASDWGRFVYCLRDAKGERWVSVGRKGEWNVDDVHCWSAFNFDGWRYQRFEMPGNAAWDCYREAGTSFWGYYGQGDGIVDLPLSLEKIIVERRTHVIKVDELLLANPEDVLLADLYAEYEKEADRTEEAIRLSRLRMPSSLLLKER